MGEMPVALWAVFFLVQTGRGAALDQMTPKSAERVLGVLYDLSLTVAVRDQDHRGAALPPGDWQRAHARAAAGPHAGGDTAASAAVCGAPRSVSDGNGFVFIDHVGQSARADFCRWLRQGQDGFRRPRLSRRPLFMQLRDIDGFEGKCGRCEFRHVCGGSRARAFAATGSPFGSDPLCAYEPEEGDL